MKTIKVIELIGTSTQSWEDAANNAAKEARDNQGNLGIGGGGADSSD